MTDHECPAPDCPRPVPRSMLACKHHWFMVPKPMRDELWRAYKSDGMGSSRHMTAAAKIVEWFGSEDYINALDEAPEWTL